MNKKILLGSIIAVAILVLVSFTGVVGYQTTKSSTIANASPLFTIRCSRAIDEENKDFVCDYVGKGEEITIPLPLRNDRAILLEKIKDRISKMDIPDEIREQAMMDIPISTICDLTTDFPILCFLDKLYNILFYLIRLLIENIIGPLFFLLYFLAYIFIKGELPPTIWDYSTFCLPYC